MVPFKGPCLVRCFWNCRKSRRGAAPPLPSHALNQNKPTQNSYINATFLLSHQDASTRMYLKLSGRPQSCVNVEKLKMLLHITFEFKRISFTVSVCIGEILAKTLQTMMYAKLIQQRLWPCHASRLFETTPTILPRNQ